MRTKMVQRSVLNGCVGASPPILQNYEATATVNASGAAISPGMR